MHDSALRYRRSSRDRVALLPIFLEGEGLSGVKDEGNDLRGMLDDLYDDLEVVGVGSSIRLVLSLWGESTDIVWDRWWCLSWSRNRPKLSVLD